MCVDIVERFLLHIKGFYGLRLDLAHHLYSIFDTGFDGREESSAGPGCAGSLQQSVTTRLGQCKLIQTYHYSVKVGEPRS